MMGLFYGKYQSLKQRRTKHPEEETLLFIATLFIHPELDIKCVPE
jgi:hypothetical protein